LRLAPRSHVAIVASFVAIVLAFQGVAIVSHPDVSEARENGRSRYRFTQAERCLMKKINRRRAHRGNRRLDWDKQLGYIGRRHARNMAKAGSTWHSGNLTDLITRWSRLGQTVGRAGRCRAMFRAFWRSAPHRKIMMGRWRFMGVGTARRNGRIYVLQIFESRRNPGNTFSYP
jgi:uncharacterized protein YkwD